MNWARGKLWLQSQWPLGQAAAMAVLLESSAPKAGNVSPGVAFGDMDFTDFLASGIELVSVFSQTPQLTVGQLIWRSVQATRLRCGVNTNLGTVLLMAPLAKASEQLRARQATAGPESERGARHESGLADQGKRAGQAGQVNRVGQDVRVERAGQVELAGQVEKVLAGLTAEDAQQVYAAIGFAQPGGLGRAARHDVQHSPPANLREAMVLAAPVDAVARQYVNGFKDVFQSMVHWLQRGLVGGAMISDLICELQLRWLATELDGLIVRKAGLEIANQAQQLAIWALDEYLETERRGRRWQALDSFLRSDGHLRNPGTTADLIAAGLFAHLIAPPPSTTWIKPS